MNRLLVYRVGLALAIATLFVGCVDDTGRQETSAANASVKADFAGRLLEIARNYEGYRLSDEKMRVTAAPCAAVQPHHFIHGLTPAERSAKMSSSPDASTHGKKMYFLFIKNGGPFEDSGSEKRSQPIGQVIVKEAWVPEEMQGDDRRADAIRRKVKVRRGNAWVEDEVSFAPYVS